MEWSQYRDAPTGGTVRQCFGIQTLSMCWFIDTRGVLRERNGESDPEGITRRLLAE